MTSNNTILIADDSELNREILRILLVNNGYKVDEANNGREAVEKAKSNTYPVILMDIHMPVLNGIDACGMIRETNRNAKIIAVSSTDTISQAQLLEAGFDDIIRKPYSKATLFHILEEYTTTPGNPVNTKALDDIAGDNKTFRDEMIQSFIEAINTGLNEIQTACKEKNWENVFAEAHKIISTCAYFDADNLYLLLKYFENVKYTPVDETELQYKLEQLNHEVQRTSKALQAAIN